MKSSKSDPDLASTARSLRTATSRSADSSPIAQSPGASVAQRWLPRPPLVGAGHHELRRPAGRPAAPTTGLAAPNAGSTISFSAAEQRDLNRANRVLVLEYSSTGGGHTARSLDPVLIAADPKNDRQTLHKDDCVVVLAPPRWESDKDGSKVNTLHDKADALRKLGIKVIVKQADKSVTGLYQKNGDSDNVRMLQDFVYKPQRDAAKTPLSTERIKGGSGHAPVQHGPGAPAKNLLKAVELAVGTGGLDKISILGDMAPFLQKAAAQPRSPFPFNGSVEIGNHQGLFIGDARKQLGGKDLAYLHKASGSGHAQKLALVEYAPDVNVVRDLAPTLAQLGIDGNTSKLQAREKVLQHLLADGEKLSLKPGDKARPGILVSPGAKEPKDVKAMVYLYLNEYTQGAVDHIREQMAAKPETYGKSLFAVCGRNAFKHDMQAGKASNILQVMYAANADGVTNAGFGTTSEFYYMAHKPQDYAGKFVAFPVVNQHEQQANAAELSGVMPHKVTNATGPAPTMYAAMDELVAARSAHPHTHLSGNMAQLAKASTSKTSGAQHAAGLIADLYKADEAPSNVEGERPNARSAKTEMASYDADHAAKQSRRIYKLYVPALDAIIKGEDTCAIRATSKAASEQKSVEQIVDLLRGIADPAKRPQAQQLMGVEFNNANAQELAKSLGDRLHQILTQKTIDQHMLALGGGTEANGAAKAALTELKDLAEKRVALGW
jgi:hypothetical protein